MTEGSTFRMEYPRHFCNSTRVDTSSTTFGRSVASRKACMSRDTSCWMGICLHSGKCSSRSSIVNFCPRWISCACVLAWFLARTHRFQCRRAFRSSAAFGSRDSMKATENSYAWFCRIFPVHWESMCDCTMPSCDRRLVCPPSTGLLPALF